MLRSLLPWKHPHKTVNDYVPVCGVCLLCTWRQGLCGNISDFPQCRQVVTMSSAESTPADLQASNPASTVTSTSGVAIIDTGYM